MSYWGKYEFRKVLFQTSGFYKIQSKNSENELWHHRQD